MSAGRIRRTLPLLLLFPVLLPACSHDTHGDVPAYRITYEVEDHREGAARHLTQVLDVQRPYAARLTTLDRRGAITETIEVADRVATVTDNGAVVRARPPGPARLDLRPHALQDAAALGVARDAEGDRVMGRDCTWYETQAPVAEGAITTPGDGNRTRTCVDDDGLLLAEEWFVGGILLRRRTARQVETGAVSEISIPRTTPSSSPSPTAVETLRSPSNDFVLAPLAPAPTAALRTVTARTEPGPAGEAAVEAERWVYDDGLDVWWIEQRRSRRRPPAPPSGVPVEVDAVAGAHAEVGPTGVTIRWVEGDVTIAVGGTVRLSALLDWVAALARRRADITD